MNESEALLKEINERLIRIEAWQQAERKRRIICLSVIALVLLILLIIIVPKAVSMVRSYNEMSARMAEITDQVDLAKVGDVINKINDIDLEALASTAEQIKDLDIAELKNTIDKINQIDFAGLQNIIDKLGTGLSRIGGLFS